MSERQDIQTSVVVEGQTLQVRLLENPTIDDVVMAEMQIQAAQIATGVPYAEDRRVERNIRDFLIRLGVER